MPQIPQEIIEQIAAANDIVEVIGGYFPLRRMGGTFKALCPFHNERTPSFNVNPHRQIFKCFGCGAGGSVFRFVMDYEHLDFVAAVRKLADKAGIKIPEAEMSQADYERADLRRRLLSLHAEAAEFFHQQLMRGNSADAAREYMKKRGLSAEVAKSWKIGFAPDSWDGLLSAMQAGGFSEMELKESGLFSHGEDSGKMYDRFRGRVMFPICNDTGEVIAFSGRVLFAEQSPAKYVNSPETPLFTKGNVLFGLNKSKRALIAAKQAIVCEGQVDLITAFEAGVQNVIAPQGTAFTDRQARILKRYVDEVVLCFDADAAGEKAAERSLPHLLAEGLLVRVMTLPQGEDPDSLIRTQGAEVFRERVAAAKDFFDHQIDRLTGTPDFATPRGKIAAARKLAELLAFIPDGIAREAVLNNAAMRLGASAQDLRVLIKRAPQRAVLDEENPEPERAEPITLDATKEWLAHLALRSPAARMWLQAQGCDRVLNDGQPDSVLLLKILDADFRADEPASMNAWLATLEPGEESALSSALSRDVPPEARVVAEDCWHELERRVFLRKRQAIEAQLRAPGLAIEDMARLHSQVLDIQRQLAALPPPRAPKPAG
ncbi:MAG: DNA primase [Verrucomicrobia bacterium]|jgi:DNA primase|nr:DNA primase [Verrucomicrobiota bacterium]